jgi:hypothetical protein
MLYSNTGKKECSTCHGCNVDNCPSCKGSGLVDISQDDLVKEYSNKSRSLFNNSQRLRSRYSLCNVLLMFTILVSTSIVVGTNENSVFRLIIFSINWLLIFILMVARFDKKMEKYAMNAVTSLNYAHKLEQMLRNGDYNELEDTITSFEEYYIRQNI